VDSRRTCDGFQAVAGVLCLQMGEKYEKACALLLMPALPNPAVLQAKPAGS
jgi:hypothetical protein